VGLCSDAGYPGISDPGYRVVSEALDGDFRVEVIPGAGAVTAAVVSSGLPTSSYTFKGFPPRRPGVRKRFLREEAGSPHTLVLFESPHRIKQLLADALDVFGNRKAAVCIELTKRFEQVHRGYLSELVERFASGAVKGEIAVVVAGSNPKFALGAEDTEGEVVEDR
jgi:16S rRNA (cytidine1402-2'-O)-methyltransferase